MNSVKCKHISRDTQRLATELLKNKNFLRYVHYLGDEHPLSDTLDTPSFRDIRRDNIHLTLFNEKVLKEKLVSIFLNPITNPFHDTTLSMVNYQLDIIIPYRNWTIDTDEGFELRGWEIAAEIAKSLDQRQIAGIGDVKMLDASAGYLNKQYSVLTVIIGVTHSAAKISGGVKS